MKYLFCIVFACLLAQACTEVNNYYESPDGGIVATNDETNDWFDPPANTDEQEPTIENITVGEAEEMDEGSIIQQNVNIDIHVNEADSGVRDEIDEEADAGMPDQPMETPDAGANAEPTETEEDPTPENCTPSLTIQRTTMLDGTVPPGLSNLTVMAFTVTASCKDMEVRGMNFHISAKGYDAEDDVPFVHASDVDGTEIQNFSNAQIRDPAIGTRVMGPSEPFQGVSNQRASIQFRDVFTLTANVPRRLTLTINIAPDFQTDSRSTSYGVFFDGADFGDGDAYLTVLDGQTPPWGSFTVEADNCVPRYTLTRNSYTQDSVSQGTTDFTAMSFNITASNCHDINIQSVSLSLYQWGSNQGDDMAVCSAVGCPEGSWYFTNVRVMDGADAGLGSSTFVRQALSVPGAYLYLNRATLSDGSIRIPAGTTHTLDGVIDISDAPIENQYVIDISAIWATDAIENNGVRRAIGSSTYTYAPFTIVE